MSYELKTIDGLGVFVPVTGVTAADGWPVAKDTAINLMALGESENYFYDNFTDADAVSGENFEHDAINKCLKNTITSEIPATPGGSLLPAFEAADGSGTTYTKNGYTINTTASTGYSNFYGGFNGQTDSSNSGNAQLYFPASDLPVTITILFPSMQTISGYKGYTYYNGSFYPSRGWRDWTVEVTTDGGTSWTVVDTQTGFNSWPSAANGYEFPFAENQVINGIRFIVAAAVDGSHPHLTELQIIGAGTEATPGAVNEATIMLDNYVPQIMPEKCKLKLWFENVDDGSVAADLGNSGNNKIECYLSTDSGSTFTSALYFTPANLQPAPNVNVHDSEEIDLTGATGIQVKLQSFDRGSGAPNFKWHAALALEKTGD